MSSRWIHTMQAAALAGAFVLAAAGCHHSNGVLTPSGGGASNLTVTNAAPPDGNATLTSTGTLVVNNSGTGADELNLSEMTGTVGHDVTLTWDTTTHALRSAS